MWIRLNDDNKSIINLSTVKSVIIFGNTKLLFSHIEAGCFEGVYKDSNSRALELDRLANLLTNSTNNSILSTGDKP